MHSKLADFHMCQYWRLAGLWSLEVPLLHLLWVPTAWSWTRFLAAKEAGIAKGWQNEIIRVKDGGTTTKRSTLCDRLKETVGWPEHYDGRAVVNKGHLDEEAGLSDAENVRLYKEELKRSDQIWGDHGRMVTYAGTGVGLIKGAKSAAEIVDETSSGALQILQRGTGTMTSRL